MKPNWWWLLDLLMWITYLLGPSLAVLVAVLASLWIAFNTFCLGIAVTGP